MLRVHRTDGVYVCSRAYNERGGSEWLAMSGCGSEWRLRVARREWLMECRGCQSGGSEWVSEWRLVGVGDAEANSLKRLGCWSNVISLTIAYSSNTLTSSFVGCSRLHRQALLYLPLSYL